MYRCPVCSSTDIEIIVDRKNVLVHQNLQFNSEKAAKDAKTGNLKMQLCHDCGFVFNSEFNPKLISYCEEYDNRQTCSPAFHSYIADLAHKVATHGKKAETKVVEVGCGNGEFINLILSLNNFSNKWIGYGFDPSYQGPLESLDGRLQFVQSYYDQEASSIDADLVCCRHVIEHVPDPVSMVASVRKALSNSSQARVFFETPCIEWIFQNFAVWDFFYEHCSLFSAKSLSHIFQMNNFEVHSVDHIFGDQYLWLEAGLSNCKPNSYSNEALIRIAKKYKDHETTEWNFWRKLLEDESKKGKVALWGAGAKGSTFASFLDPQQELITSLIDINPNKQNRWIGGSAHPILSPAKAKEIGIDSVIIMNPLYVEEIKMIMSKENLDVRITGKI